MTTKKAMRSLALLGYAAPGRETPWVLEALRELERLSKEWSDNDRDFAAAYNLQENKAAAVFTRRLTNGVCTLPFAINVASVTRTGAGLYVAVFDMAMSDAAYLIQAMPEYGAAGGVHVAISSKTTAGFTMTFHDIAGTAADPAANVHLTIMGNG
jgi:hypothetical protein